MSFLHSLMRGLGFGADDDNDEVLSDNTTESDDTSAESPSPQHTAQPEIEEIKDLDFDKQMSAVLLDNVINIFNSALPDFLRRSIDPEAQRKALADALDASVTEYLADLRAKSDAIAEARLRNASEAAKAAGDKLIKENEILRQQKEKMREQQLSSERRSRALKDRVTDLESQVASLEAEREQFQLENSSLLNKIRLTQLKPDEIEDLRAQIDTLKNQDSVKLLDEAQAEVQRLSSELQALQAQLESANADLAQARQQADDNAQAVQLANQMYNNSVEELTGEHEAHLATKAELTKTQAELAELSEMAEQVQDLTQKLESVAEIIDGRDKKIAELKAANKKLRAQLDQATPKPTTPSQAEPLNLISRDPDTLDSLDAIDGIDNEPDGLLTLSDDPSMYADDDFECPDWFVGEPQSGNTTLQREPNLDFGYTAPPKRPKMPENDAQLSLF